MARSKSSNTTSNAGCGGCGCWLAVLAVNLLIGGSLVNYDAWCITGNIPPPAVAVIAGLFLAEPALLAAVIFWVLGACGMHFPLMH